MALHQKIAEIKKQFLALLKTITTEQALEELRIAYLGRKGSVSSLMEELKTLSLQEKQKVGPLLNTLKQDIFSLLEEKKHFLHTARVTQEQEKKKYFDVTAYKANQPHGSLHPLTHVVNRVNTILTSMGYTIAEGPEVETDYYNFDALNIPPSHPARDMWDTLWLDIPGLLLRTHTSSVQIRTMQQQKAPLAIAAPGRAYRHEATDATHDYLFMQVEGLLVDKNISVSNLLATLRAFMQALFDKKNLKIRVRPSYFPFVEPGIEVDVECPFCNHGCSLCKHTEWIEMGGAGLVHPHVFEACSINAKEYSGFAFGLGLTRLAMIHYALNDIRLLHGGNVKFLEQF